MGKGLQEQSLSAALCAQPRSRLCRLDPQSSPGSQRGPQAPARPKCAHAAPKSATAQPRRCSGFPFAHPEPEAGTAATRRCRGEGGTPSSRGLDTVEEQEAAEGHRGAQPQPISPARIWRCPRNAPTARGGEGKHGGATTLPALGAARNNPSGVKQRGINLLPTGVPKPTAGTGFGKHPLRGPPCLAARRGGAGRAVPALGTGSVAGPGTCGCVPRSPRGPSTPHWWLWGFRPQNQPLLPSHRCTFPTPRLRVQGDAGGVAVTPLHLQVLEQTLGSPEPGGCCLSPWGSARHKGMGSCWCPALGVNWG